MNLTSSTVVEDEEAKLSTDGRLDSVCWEIAFFNDFGGLSSERKRDETGEVIESRPVATELLALESRP